jgi:PKD repeat protein
MSGGQDRKGAVVRRLGLGLLVGVVVVVALPASAGAVVVQAGNGQRYGVLLRRGVGVSALKAAQVPATGRVAAPNGNVDYHGGPILHSSAPYLIFWDPSGAISAHSKTVLEQYLSDTAADSGKATDVFSVLRQYTDSSGFADYQQTFSASQAILDTQPYPTIASGCTTGSGYPNCLTDAQLQAEVTRLINARSLPTGIGPNAPIYFLITPQDTNICSPALGCADPGFCAYHSSFTDGSNHVLYASVPFIVWTINSTKGCQDDGNTFVYQTPNNDPADNIADDLSHELSEMITDPLTTGWWSNASGREVADNCESYGSGGPLQGQSLNAYAPILGGSESAGNLYDQVINGDHYYTQTDWSNGDVGCKAQTSADALTPDFTDSVNGVVASFDPTTSTQSSGSITSVSWDFGDGSTAFSTGSPALVSHSYARPGTYTVTLTLVDSLGNLATVSHPVTAGNLPPTASFTGPTSGIPGAAVTFDGGGSSDSGGSIVGYSWSFGDGATSAAGPTTSHTYSAAGTYTVTLTVTDSSGLQATTSHQITIDEPPVASFTGPTAGLAGAAVTFAGGGSSDPDGSIVGYSWSFGDGATSVAGPTISHTYSAAGTYTVTLTVTDSSGLQAMTSHQITVDEPPTAAFTGPASGAPGAAVTFDGGGSSDPDGSIVGYSWSFGDGATSAAGPTTSHTYSAAGKYTVTLTVTDSRGLQATTSHQITIDEPPTASFTGPTSGIPGAAVTFAGGGSSDPGGSIVGYSWSFGDGATSAAGPTTSHTYWAAGAYTVTLTVTDSSGLQAMTSHQITVDEPPASSTGPTPGVAGAAVMVDELPAAALTGPTAGLAGAAVTFDGSGSSDPDGSIVGYSWSFGDGATSAAGPTTSHTYSASGTYTVTLTVTDSSGLQATSTHQIAISAAGLGKGKVSGNTATLTVTCKGATACSVALQLRVTETSKRGNVIAVIATSGSTKVTQKTVVIGNVSVSLSGGQTRTIRIRLNRAGQQLLAKFHRIKVKLAAVSAGQTVSYITVTFKARETNTRK